MNQLRKVEALTSIEWYDGLVTGFVRFQDGVFLCVLLAHDASSSRRCYLLVQVDSNVFPMITFNDVGGYYRSALKTAFEQKLDLYVTTDEPLQEGDLSLKEATGIQASDLTSLQFPRIDEAVLQTSIAKWL